MEQDMGDSEGGVGVRIAIVSGIGGEPRKLTLNSSVRGFCAFACLPGDVYHMNPDAFDWDYDAVIIIMTSTPELLSKMAEIARSFKGIKLVLDSDPPLEWLSWFPSLSMEAIEIYRMCDGTLCHHRMQPPLLRFVTDKPAFYVPEPSWLASHKISPDEGERDIILIPRTHCSGHNTRRNTLINYLILKGIQEETGIKAIACGSESCGAGDLWTDEYDLIRQIGVDVEIVNPETREEMFELYKRAVLMINMDCTFCVGHWLVDAAASGIPAICSPFPDASQCFPLTQAHPLDVERGVELGLRLLRDERFRRTVISTAWKKVDIYSFSEVRKRWSELMRAVGGITARVG